MIAEAIVLLFVSLFLTAWCHRDQQRADRAEENSATQLRAIRADLDRLIALETAPPLSTVQPPSAAPTVRLQSPALRPATFRIRL